MRNISRKKLFFSVAIGPIALFTSGCSLASLPKNYSPIEKQTVAELSGSNYVPRSDEEREAIETQDMFAQTAFWSREYDLNPADLEAAINLSANLRKMGNPGKSIEVAQHTRALYPRDVDLMTELSASLISNNDTNEALTIINKALYQRPRSARLWSLKGAAMDQLERFGEARQSYTKALGFAPNDPSILANVGLSYALEGDPKTAEIWLRRAATLPGANPNVRQNLALVLGLQGKLDEAEKWAKQDLNQDGAKQNLAYIRSLRGSSAVPTPKSQPVANRSPARTTTSQRSNAPRGYNQKIKPQNAQYSSRTKSPNVTGAQKRTNAPAPRVTTTPVQPAKFGAKITVAGDPSQMQGGPKNVSEATLDVLRQRNSALRNMPSSPKTAELAIPQTQAQKGTNPVLSKISQNNAPKITIAQYQQAQLAQRAAYAVQQRQQQTHLAQQRHPYPPQQAQRQPNGQLPRGQMPNGQMLNGQMMINGRPAPMPPAYNNTAMQQGPYAVPQPYYADTRPPARTRRR